MSSKRRFIDRSTGIVFQRTGNDYLGIYRLFELQLLSNRSIYYNHHARWLFFSQTLRDLFEMPDISFWDPVMNCMQNHGKAFVLVPLRATSITSEISALAISMRKPRSFDSLYVCYVATRREHRRLGLATRLLQRLVRHALDEQHRGIRTVIMHVNTLNIAALNLYERCGWRCYTYLPAYLTHEPHHATNHAFAMRLRLEHVRNVSELCRHANAIEIEPSDDEESQRTCHRTPMKF
jgi:ribosomal protein S18 acetylase RimI-like enzyme